MEDDDLNTGAEAPDTPETEAVGETPVDPEAEGVTEPMSSAEPEDTPEPVEEPMAEDAPPVSEGFDSDLHAASFERPEFPDLHRKPEKKASLGKRKVTIIVAAVAAAAVLVAGAVGLNAKHSNLADLQDQWSVAQTTLTGQMETTTADIAQGEKVYNESDGVSAIASERAELASAISGGKAALSVASDVSTLPDGAGAAELRESIGDAKNATENLETASTTLTEKTEPVAAGISAQKDASKRAITKQANALSTSASDASKLLASSKGKVADEATRTALKSKIDAAVEAASKAKDSTAFTTSEVRGVTDTLTAAQKELDAAKRAVTDSVKKAEAADSDTGEDSTSKPSTDKKGTPSDSASESPKSDATQKSTAQPEPYVTPTGTPRSVTAAEVMTALSNAHFKVGTCPSGSPSFQTNSTANAVAMARVYASILTDATFDVAGSNGTVTVSYCGQ